LSVSVKIRILLALLCASLMFTAVIVRWFYTPQDNLTQSAKTLEDHLHKKEKWVNQLLVPQQFNRLKTLGQTSQQALDLIDDYTSHKRIWILTLLNGKTSFWSGIKVLPDNPATIKEGTSFLHQPNGYYEVIKKTQGNFSALFFIPIRSDYQIQNQYLGNCFDRDLLNDDNLEIADITDQRVTTISSYNHQYLFSAKLKKGHSENYIFLNFEVLLWGAGLFVLCLLVHLQATHYANRGRIWLSVGILSVFIIGLRFVNLYFKYPSVIYELGVFSHKFYRNGPAFPSLGDLCLNILGLCWLASFVYYYRHRLLRSRPLKVPAYVIAIVGTVVLALLLTQLLNLFSGLVIKSGINFDVDNILNLSAYSVLAVIVLCFCLLSVFLFNEAFVSLTNRLMLTQNEKIYVVAGSMLLLTAASTWYHQQFTLLFILWGLIVLIRGYAVIYSKGRFEPFSFLSIIIIFSLIVSIKFSGFRSVKEKELRKVLIHKLENADDTIANQLFRKVEKRIAHDQVLTDYFLTHTYTGEYLKTHFQSNYFDGYLADYNLKINEFNSAGEAIDATNRFALTDFKDMVLYSSFKVSDYFYRENNAFGFKSYFAIIPVYQESKLLGTIIIDLKSKPLQFNYSYPQVLVNSQLSTGNEFKDYSYAFYSNGNLQSQNGKYIYNTVNTDFTGKLKTYTFKTTQDANQAKPWFQRIVRYNHLIYQPSQRKLIIVTREDDTAFNSITTLTFFFIVLLAFGLIAITVIWLWARVKVLSIKNNHLTWSFRVKFNRILYKTRIQLFMIFAVVLTLALVGVITYLSIKSQYIEQQDEMMADKVTRVASAFEVNQIDRLRQITESSQLLFNEFAENFSADMTLFNSAGVPVLATQPKIYDYGLLARRMNGRAYIQLSKLQKSVVVNSEQIGDLKFKSAYAPIRDSKNMTIGYLQLPYFSNEADYKERIGSLLNAMINIYALIFIAIGLLAVIVARQITAPLNFIQQSLSRTVYGKKNEPIAWERDDEIGALVKEYNQMIAALEHSAHRLAQSERESAWREMAKQVAHEIKNPLTPLKLGLQLLEKSWKDKDPKFDAKFERFSKSFVEQIESLSSIASEFSAFAKMPDTRMERVNILDLLSQAVTIFKHMDNVKITYDADDAKFMILADRDQLLRCFNNLLKNAIEAMPPGRPGLIEIEYNINQHSILLKIKDNGNGIPDTLRERIFEPNFTTKSSGTGLGLAFVKNSIENAGGKVWFETETNAGTTFFLNFPKSRF
jgi:two-component system nitrogen regulation sensor histidine kinase NtrY